MVAYRNGSRETYNFSLGEHPTEDIGFIGVTRQAQGISGISVSDFGIQPYPSQQYLALLGGEGNGPNFGGPVGSFFGKVVVTLFLPLGSLALPSFPFPFAGFTPDITNFFVVQGPLSVLGGGVFTLANVLFWTGWINIQLGFFNCIPAFSRLPVSSSHELTRTVTTTVGLTMFVAFLLLVFGPQIVSG